MVDILIYLGDQAVKKSVKERESKHKLKLDLINVCRALQTK